MRTAALVAFGVTLVLSPLLLAILRRREVLDIPNERSSHDRPTPRGGGNAIAVGTLAAAASTSLLVGSTRTAFLLGAASFGLLGLGEDLIGVPALLRLALQTLAAAVTLPWLTGHMTGPTIWRVVFAVGATFWIVAFVNAFNFMDGINGISIATAVVAGGLWYPLATHRRLDGIAVASIALAAAAIAFAPFNFPRALMFPGDVGSYFIGSWLAIGAVLLLRAGLTPEAAVGPLLPYLADTGCTLVKRVRQGEVWHLPHRSHTYQRLVSIGWTHAETTLGVGTLMLLCGVLAGLTLTVSWPARVGVDGVLVALLTLYLAAPRLAESLSLTRAHAG